MNFTAWLGGWVNKDVNSNSHELLPCSRSGTAMRLMVVHRFGEHRGFITWSRRGCLLESQGGSSTHITFQKHVTKLTDSKSKSGLKDRIIWEWIWKSVIGWCQPRALFYYQIIFALGRYCGITYEHQLGVQQAGYSGSPPSWPGDPGQDTYLPRP